MTKLEKQKQSHPDNKWFKFYCNNPKGKITCDCVIRALSEAMEKDYEVVYRELFECSLKTGFMINDPVNYKRYLKENGWTMQKQPKSVNNSKVRGWDFVEKYGRQYPRCILHIGHNHITCMVDGKIKDIWNCTGRVVGNFWIKDHSK